MKKAKRHNYIWETIKIIYKGAPLRFLICIVLLICISLFFPLNLFAINLLVNTITSDWITIGVLFSSGIFFVFTLLLMNSKSFINILGSYLWITAEISLQRALMKKASQKDLVFYDTPSFYKALEKAKQGYSHALGTTMMLLSTIFITVFSSVLTMGFLARINWTIAIALLLIIVVKIIWYFFETKRIQTLRDKQSSDVIKRKLFSEYLWNKESRVYGASKYFLNKWNEKNHNLIKNENNMKRKNLGFSFLVEVIIYSCYALIVVFTVITQVNRIAISIGEIIILFVAMEAVFNNINTIVLQLGGTMQNASLSKELFEFIFSEDKSSINNEVLHKNHGICFENVSFKYPTSEEDSLRGINIKISPGENIAIVGKNGSGKTTLIKLLSRLYSPTAGQVTFSKDIGLIKDGYKNTTAMFQEVCAYNLTVGENVIISEYENEYTDEEVEEIIVGLLGEKWFEQLAEGLNTPIGRAFGGMELSGGEKQRLALARVLFRDSSLVFLDEPTSAIDPLSEERLYKEFLEISKGKTTFFVTHRLASIRYADRIIVLDDGQVIEQGTHKELLENGKQYAYMYEMQKGKF